MATSGAAGVATSSWLAWKAATPPCNGWQTCRDWRVEGTKTSITVCAIALNSPTTPDIGLLAEYMVKAKRTQRGQAHVHDIRIKQS